MDPGIGVATRLIQFSRSHERDCEERKRRSNPAFFPRKEEEGSWIASAFAL